MSPGPVSTDASPRSLVPPGERILADVKPNLLFIVLGPLGWILVTVLLTAGAVWALSLRGAPVVPVANVILLGAGLVVFRIIVEALDWAMRRYVLTDRRVLAARGILRRYTTDIPLHRVQHLTLFRSIRERLVGAGTIGIATAGTGGIEMFWIRVSDYDRLMSLIRDAAQQAPPPPSMPAHLTPSAPPPPGHHGPDPTAAPAPAPAPSAPEPVIIGLVGGIGAGKSAVAAAFGRAGFVVVDSDREARDMLLRPDVRDTLVGWWGSRILDDQGRVDRRSVADIVFASPPERLRLEALIHPLLGHSRPELVARASEAGAPGVVVDAPLLLEAGLDRACDEIVFVDAPREQRLARVSARGWDQAEFDRRERAQMPLEEKKARAGRTIVNDAGPELLDPRVRELVPVLTSARKSTPGTAPTGVV